MDLRRLSVTKPYTLFISVTRPLTHVISTTPQPQQDHHSQPPPLKPQSHSDSSNSNLIKCVSSILSKPSLDHSKCKLLLPSLCPHEFDRLLLDLRLNVNPKTVLNFFYFASDSCKFRFTVRSYCLLIRLLLFSNLLSPARLLLIRLIDGKMPVVYLNNPKDRHIEIAAEMVDLNVVTERDIGFQVADLLVHVYCTQFKNVGFSYAIDVLSTFSSKGIFPSLKTCNFLLSSLVKANEVQKGIEMYETICRGVCPDVYLFSTAINAFCKGGRIEDAIGLFTKMEELGIAPNIVTYNNIIHGLCKNGRLDEAFQFKEKMVLRQLEPSLVTYSILINGFIKLEKFDDANYILNEMSNMGFVPNEFVYNTLIDGYCKNGNINEALDIRDDMISKGMSPNSVTFNSLIQGFCKSGQMDHAENVLEEMLSRGLVVNQGAFTSVIRLLCVSSKFDSALRFVEEMLLRNLRPGDGLLTSLLEFRHEKLIVLYNVDHFHFPVIISSCLVAGLVMSYILLKRGVCMRGGTCKDRNTTHHLIRKKTDDVDLNDLIAGGILLLHMGDLPCILLAMASSTSSIDPDQ
ncbi:hypothetical protein Pint_02559 [Pistacia integerrima]|uniref:Uncharacterized protein n=1 Tax=Pistacia integerrima TaxID=434235 RepID=A0ACC0ZIR4_9ROSI|nr:hypothetical protein Pint_02559 [Pistacia integerrima]